MADLNRYSQIIAKIFKEKFKPEMRELEFTRTEIIQAAARLKVDLPKNIGDVIYSFRYRAPLPESIRSAAPKGDVWVIRPAGSGKYRLVLITDRPLSPNENLMVTKVPDATPGIVAKYALTDEQALLAKVRYNRLVDIFTGVACYSLQSHLRTTVPELGQVETDEIYVGIDKRGVHYVFPVQAKTGKDKIGIIQIEQDFALCAKKYPTLLCRPLAAKFIHGNVIALFEFGKGEEGVGVASEKHYRLVPPEDVTDTDLSGYQTGDS